VADATWTEHPTRGDAFDAEARAIRQEQPLFNVTHRHGPVPDPLAWPRKAQMGSLVRLEPISAMSARRSAPVEAASHSDCSTGWDFDANRCGRRKGDGLLDSYCWCERSRVRIDRAMVRRGLTVSCGRSGCTEQVMGSTVVPMPGPAAYEDAAA
jgi:hypothetical protein